MCYNGGKENEYGRRWHQEATNQDNLDLWAIVSGLTFPLSNIESHLGQMV